MEEKKEKTARKYRGKAAIVKLLQEQIQSGQNIKSFCAGRDISEGSFHNWKQRYGAGGTVPSAGFATLQLTADPGLFAMVGVIRIYQPVSAAYLKELLS